MAYIGQPVPTMVETVGAAKISDGKSVRVSVPANSGDITAGEFCYFGGFLGVAMQNLSNNTSAAQDLILQIEVAEDETKQLTDGQDFDAGTKIYWNNTTKKFTETPTTVFAGVVTNGKDNDGVIWFVLMPGIINDQAAEVIGALTDLDTTDKSSVVGAINEVAARVASNVTCADDADADAVRTALRELLAALETAGLMAPADGGGQ